jgi:hypothetical protein
MKYSVPVTYRLRRVLTVHAANPDQAEMKAEKVVEGWNGTFDIKAEPATTYTGEEK